MTDKEKHLEFLSLHQPMPTDEHLDKETLAQFDEARVFFMHNPEPECIKLLLNSFGKGNGAGIYQLVEDTLLKQDEETVVKELKNSLQSDYPSVRYWSAQCASVFPDLRLSGQLLDLIEQDDFDTK